MMVFTDNMQEVAKRKEVDKHHDTYISVLSRTGVIHTGSFYMSLFIH